jgi:hypothetical protein
LRRVGEPTPRPEKGGETSMRVTFTLSGKDPATQAMMRQLATLAAPSPSARVLSPFPLSLLERSLRAGLDGLERAVRWAVTAIGRKRAG